MAIEDIHLIDRRVIEAQAVVPLIQAFARIVGLDQAKEVLQKLNEETSREYGRSLAAGLEAVGIKELAQELAAWGEGGVLEEEVLELTDTVYAFNVTRCQYAEKYKALGFGELGTCLSCCRDEPFVEGFNPEIKFSRTGTIMEGAEVCDFRYELAAEPEPEEETPAEPEEPKSIWGRSVYGK